MESQHYTEGMPQHVHLVWAGSLFSTEKINDFKYSRTSMAQTRWDQQNMFETGVVRANEC